MAAVFLPLVELQSAATEVRRVVPALLLAGLDFVEARSPADSDEAASRLAHARDRGFVENVLDHSMRGCPLDVELAARKSSEPVLHQTDHRSAAEAACRRRMDYADELIAAAPVADTSAAPPAKVDAAEPMVAFADSGDAVEAASAKGDALAVSDED